MHNILHFKDEIPYNTLITWSRQLMDNTEWRFIGWAGPAKEPYRHWAAYPEIEGVLKDLWECINDTLSNEGVHIKPERVVMNLFNHGDSSWIHRDSDHSEDWTVVVFLNEFWDPNWGGDFAIFDENGRVLQAFAPYPGDFIAFPSTMKHAARPVSREAPYPRFGAAFQCKSDDSHLQRLQKPKISSVSAPL